LKSSTFIWISSPWRPCDETLYRLGSDRDRE
jgi:hypothetical protein